MNIVARWLDGIFGPEAKKPSPYVWGDDPIDGLLSSATVNIIVHGQPMEVHFYRTDVPGQVPSVEIADKMVPGGLIINTEDKRMWLVNKDNEPQEVELKYVDTE